jgi:hypothetical protein
MHTISSKVVTLVLLLNSAAPLLADSASIFDPAAPLPDNVPLKIRVRDEKSKLAVATVTLTTGSGPCGLLRIPGEDEFSAALPRGTVYSCTITSPGKAPLTFVRSIPQARTCEWVSAKVIMYPPASGRSYLTEYRIGYTRDNEQPTKDACRFNVWVRDFTNGNPLTGAVLSFYDSCGNLVRSVSTDANGFTSFLVKETVPLTIRVDIPGYASYQTGVDPGREATWRSLEIRLRKTL